MGGKISGPVGAAIIAIVLIIVAAIAYKVIFTTNLNTPPAAKAFEDQMRAAHPLRPVGAGTASGAAPAAGYPAPIRK